MTDRYSEISPAQRLQDAVDACGKSGREYTHIKVSDLAEMLAEIARLKAEQGQPSTELCEQFLDELAEVSSGDFDTRPQQIALIKRFFSAEHIPCICGQNATLDADFVGCGQPIVEPKKVFRCTDCGVPFHLQCAKKHFQNGDVLTAEIADKQAQRWKARGLCTAAKPKHTANVGPHPQRGCARLGKRKGQNEH